jgi:hypothetical protein
LTGGYEENDRLEVACGKPNGAKAKLETSGTFHGKAKATKWWRDSGRKDENEERPSSGCSSLSESSWKDGDGSDSTDGE